MALVFAMALVWAGPQPAEAQNRIAGAISLDSALRDFSAYVVLKLPANTLTAVDVMDTPVARLGNYIADKLTEIFVDVVGLHIVSRQDFERILFEQNSQASLNFNDDTTAKIGHNMGWQNIIFGSIEPLSDTYHLSLRAVDVETGTLLGSKTYLLTGKDPVLVNIVNPALSIQSLTERDSILSPFNGTQNDFQLSVSTNKAVYYDQEILLINLRSAEDCHFVVYHLDSGNRMQLIFPNRFEIGTNFLKAGVERVIPENAYFVLGAPYGEERILVYASEQPISISEDQYRSRSISEEYLDAPQAIWQGGDGSRGMDVKSRGATTQVSYTILPKSKKN